MTPKFIEVTDLSNNTFLINSTDVLLVEQVTGRSNQLKLTVKSPEKSLFFIIQASYKEFRSLLEKDPWQS